MSSFARFHQPARAVAQAVQALGDDRVLDCNVVDNMSRVGIDVESPIDAPGERHVVENHVLAPSDTGRIGADASVAFANGKVAADQIMGIGKADSVVEKCNAAGGRLAGDRNVAGHCDHGVDVNDPPHVEHHEAIRLAHGIAKRPGSRIVEVRYVIDTGRAQVRACPGRKTPKSLCFGKSQNLSQCRRWQHHKRWQHEKITPFVHREGSLTSLFAIRPPGFRA